MSWNDLPLEIHRLILKVTFTDNLDVDNECTARDPDRATCENWKSFTRGQLVCSE